MNTSLATAGSVRLDHWGVIRARGADAVKFLQGQLTNDVSTLGPSQLRLAGFCSAKGRLQASFMVWKPAPDEVLLACSASVLGATLKRLSMFVMRAQCKLSDASAECALWGTAGDEARARLGDQAVWEVRASPGGTVLRLPDAAGLARCVIVSPVVEPAIEPVIEAAIETAGEALALDTWRWLEVRSGVPLIEAATVDQFVPQMLNYELLGGVDFRKGCYPGQEVVARSQYRGTVKRRMFLFDCDALPAPGQEVFHSSDPAQPAGMVVNAAARPAVVAPEAAAGGGAFVGDLAGDVANTFASALVEVKLAALEGGSLHLGGVEGPRLRQADLPYPVLLDAALTESP